MATINFNDAIYAQTALEAFVTALTPLRAFARDFSGEAAQVGNAIYVPRVEAMTGTTFDQTYTGSGGTVNTISVNLNRHRIVPFDLTDIQALNSSAARAGLYAAQQGRALAKIVTQDIWSLITLANFGVSLATTAAANWGRVAARAVRLAMINRDVPTERVSLITNPVIYDALLGDTNIQQAFQYGGSEAIREARIPRLVGMDVFESNLIPLNGESLAGFAVHPDAIAVAMRYVAPQEPGAYASAMAVTDPDSGLSFGYRRHFDPNTGKHHINMECLFGMAVGLSTGLGRITVP